MSRRRRGWALCCLVLVGWSFCTHSRSAGAGEKAPPRPAAGGQSSAPAAVHVGADGDVSRLERWSRVARRSPVPETDPIRLSARGWIRIFQEFVSPVDGASCTYYPSCSDYGLQAIEEHGLLLGVTMAAERVMRDHHPENAARYPLCEWHGELYYYDPVKPETEERTRPSLEDLF